MDNPLVISLVVSGIGMLMLFLALVFLYVLMYLMTALIKERPEAEEAGSRRQEAGSRRQEAGSRKQEAGGRKRRAAVIAVALARAELDLAPSGMGSEEAGDVSGWRALYHQRQLTLNLRTRRVR